MQIIFECTDQTYPVLQIDLDVEDFMGLSCTPEMLLRCKSLDDLEQVLLDSVTDRYSYFSDRDEHTDKWRIAEFKSLLTEKWKPMKQTLRIAQAYKAELDRIVISDEDIAHLHATISRLLDLIKVFSPETPVETFASAKDLISIDTLKTMQLLGFNYKAAIGEPLTQLCANAISNIGRNNAKQQNSNKSKK